jgi:hypothetical protein
MTARSRHVLWFGVGVSLGVAGIVAIVGVAAGEFGATFWRVIGTLVILFVCAAAALSGQELIDRRRLLPLAWWMLLTAPAQFATLLVANWKEHVSADYANGLVTAALFLLSGLVVATLRLIVSVETPAVVATFSAVVLSTIALDVLAIVLIWSRTTPDAALRALLALIVVIIVLYLLTPIVQRLSAPRGA